jgi:hypothetical protein
MAHQDPLLEEEHGPWERVTEDAEQGGGQVLDVHTLFETHPDEAIKWLQVRLAPNCYWQGTRHWSSTWIAFQGQRHRAEFRLSTAAPTGPSVRRRPAPCRRSTASPRWGSLRRWTPWPCRLLLAARC